MQHQMSCISCCRGCNAHVASCPSTAQVYCGDQVCAAATTEAATPPAVNAAQAYVETQVEMGITSGMRAAAIILSIIGPSTFILFYLADSMHYKKTGRPLLLF